MKRVLVLLAVAMFLFSCSDKAKENRAEKELERAEKEFKKAKKELKEAEKEYEKIVEKQAQGEYEKAEKQAQEEYEKAEEQIQDAYN